MLETVAIIVNWAFWISLVGFICWTEYRLSKLEKG